MWTLYIAIVGAAFCEVSVSRLLEMTLVDTCDKYAHYRRTPITSEKLGTYTCPLTYETTTKDTPHVCFVVVICSAAWSVGSQGVEGVRHHRVRCC